MTTKPTYTPALRVPDFLNDGEWEVKRLGEIAEKVTSKNKSNEQLPVLTNSATEGVVNQQDYFDREIVTRENLTNYHIIELNDFVYNPRVSVAAPVGAISSNKIGIGIMSPLYKIFKFKEGNIDFFEQYFRTNCWHQYLKDKANFGARFDRMNISNEDFFNLPIPFPPLAEQRRIAACLSALDEMLAATNGKLEQLKAYKKGLMQNLFVSSMGGGKSLNINYLQIPKLRFPEFYDEKEWIYYNGDKMFEPIVNKNHNSDLPVLAITQDQGAIPRDLIDYNVIVSDKSIEGYKVVEIGDFIISLRSFQGGIEYSNYKGLCSPAYIVLRKRNDDVCDDFYRYYFKSNQYIQDLNRNLEGIRDGKMVSYKQFSDIMIPCPKYEEQRKIASCLFAMDDQINAYTEKVGLLGQYKIGLMQRMFPQTK